MNSKQTFINTNKIFDQSSLKIRLVNQQFDVPSDLINRRTLNHNHR